MSTTKNDFEKKHIIEAINHLEVATELQPCPGCKSDITAITEFLKFNLMNGSKFKNREEAEKVFKEVAYIESIDKWIRPITKAITPLVKFFVKKVPDIYVKVVNEEREANKDCAKELTAAKIALEKIKRTDENVDKSIPMVESFIELADLKAGMDPIMFYTYDKVIRIGYKIHLWQLVGKISAKLF